MNNTVKKVLTLLLVVVLTAAVAIGGTLAFLTDRDNETNVFTMGNVDIKLVEEFAQGAELIPGVDINKEVQIQNVGDNDAWVFYTYSVPTALISTDGNASKNAIHFNISGLYWDLYYNSPSYLAGKGYSEPLVEWEDTWHSENLIFDDFTQNGINYTTAVYLYNGAIEPGEITSPGLDKLYLDTHVDIAPNGDMYWVENGVASNLNWNVNTTGNPIVYVNAYAIQKDNFATVQDAFQAYVKQWGKLNGEKAEAPVVAQVATADELVAAIGEADVITLTKDIAVKDVTLQIAKGRNVTLNLNGKELRGENTSAATSKLLNVAAGATLTLTSNGTVVSKATSPDTDWGTEGFPGYASNTIANSGKLIVDGVTIENKTGRGGASYAIDNYAGSELIVNSGKIIQSGGDQAIRMNSASGTAAINVTINGGEIIGRRAIWLHFAGSNASVAPAMNLTVNGGTLKSTDTDGDNLAIYSYSYGNSVANANIALNGGTYYGDVVVGAGSKIGQETVAVSDNCTFYGDVYRYVNGDTENIKIGMTLVTPETAQAALDAAKPGDTIVLGAGTYDKLTIKKFWEGDFKTTGVTPITIKGVEGTTVGAIDLNGMNFVTIENITFDSAKAVQVYAGGASGDYGNIVDSANTESQSRGANHIIVKNCVFTGTPAVDMGKFCPINFMGSNPSSWTYNITVSDCKFLTNAQNFIRMNNVTVHGSVLIEGNTFGGEGYTTNHHCINASANGGDWTIKGNTFMNWNPAKTAFATGRSSEVQVTDFVITGNTFINDMYDDAADGVIEIKTNSYTTANCTYQISGNFYEGGLAGLTDATMIERQQNTGTGFLPK